MLSMSDLGNVMMHRCNAHACSCFAWTATPVFQMLAQAIVCEFAVAGDVHVLTNY